MTPAQGSPIPQRVWVIGSAALLVCVAISVMALLRKATADRFAAVVAGILTLWMIHAFYNAIS